jgi:predicted RND superfamily exporter protein
VSGRRGAPGPLAFRYVDWTLRWGRWLWAFALALAVPAAWKTADLYAHLRTELEQLLPRTAPSVVAIQELRKRMPGLQYLGVVVDSGSSDNLAAAERLLDDLADRVRSYPRELAKSVRTGDTAERKFVEDHAPLYMDTADLETIRDRVEARRDWESSKRTGSLLDEADPPPPLDFDDIQRKYDDRARGAGQFEGTRFSSKSLHSTLLLIEAGAFETGRGHAEALLARVKSDLASLNPDTYAPGLRYGFTGDVAINVEERSALLADLSVSSVLVVVLVIAAIVLYYEWWRSIVVLIPPLALATIFAFAVASLPPLRVTELNSNTAFLGSIIVGNGINFGIVLLARYAEERRAGTGVREALAVAVWGARTGTLSAALAAGVSYASLALTQFQGFRQFGIIGGIGMLSSWVTAFVLLPPLVAWVDRGPLPPVRRPIMNAFVRTASEHKRLVAACVAVLALGAVWEVRSFGPDQIETDFSKLRRADTWQKGEGYWGRKMDALLGTYVTPTVILADDQAQARAIGQTLHEEAKEGGSLHERIAQVRTLDDIVPADQDAKIALVDAIREDLTPAIRASLNGDQRARVDRLLGSGSLRPLTVADLPESFTAGLRERDQSMGRAVLVFPRPGGALWEGPQLTAFVSALRMAATRTLGPDERPARVAGSHALSSDILESVRRDGALASAAAFTGVVVVVIALLRGTRPTLLVTASLALGVLWLAGAAMALHVKINFANFIAYPITFGIGVDYAVNVASRYELDGRWSIADAVRTTGGAVTLCSLTTIIGYSSLLIAENRALFLFGLLAVLGEVACLSAAVVAMPAVVGWLEESGDR